MTEDTTPHENRQPVAGRALNDQLGLAELAKVCANHCREGLWQPNILQNEQGVRLNAAMLLEQCAAEIQRMHASVAAERAESARLRHLLNLARDDYSTAAQRLQDIGDYAHDHSTGPAVPDALWEVRSMAYGSDA